MTVDNSKVILQNTLGILLGFDDGAEDVLDHLLTIESGDDLSEYLDQLLGSCREDVFEFVENVNLYQRGEPLKVYIGDDDNNNNSNNAVSQEYDSKPKASESQRNNNNNDTQKQQSKKSRVPPPKKTTTKSRPISTEGIDTNKANQNTKVQNQQSTSISAHSDIQNGQSENQQQKQQQQKQQPTIIKKSHPSKGKANIICGCFGTKHKPLTNCLYCGRISCELEGYDYCSFCGYMVDEAGIEGSNDKARIQKDRLLRFDRDFARRTEVIDDQSDYQQPTTWMTEEEKEDAEDNQKKQLELLKRPKQTLNIGF